MHPPIYFLNSAAQNFTLAIIVYFKNNIKNFCRNVYYTSDHDILIYTRTHYGKEAHLSPFIHSNLFNVILNHLIN